MPVNKKSPLCGCGCVIASGILRQNSMKSLTALAVVFLMTLPLAARAAEAGSVTITNASGTTTTFAPFNGAAIGSIALADLGSDGTAEILVGASDGSSPTVAVFRQDGSQIGEFLAYDAGFQGGVHVAACDVDGDGVSEIVTGARFGGGPHVRIFTNMGVPKYQGFFAYAEDFRGGVHVACGDVDGDGAGDIVTGAGPTGGPHIKVFDRFGNLAYEAFNGSAALNTGTHVRVDGQTIAAAAIAGSDEVVTPFVVVNGVLAAQDALDATREQFFAGAEADDGTTVTAEVDSELYSNTAAHVIAVDISDQRLTAYAYGIPVHSFLVSTGQYGYDTPYGTFSVLAKLPFVDYIGADYAYPHTPWNLRFKPRYYIHTAYWHNNFGHRMSHGCVNMRESEAKWVYDWAPVGTPVEIVE